MLQQSTNAAEKRCTAIMLAAGKGLRIGGDIRKQYLEIGGEPLLLHSVRTMAEDPLITDIVVMAPAGDEEMIRRLLSAHGIKGVTEGGKIRAVVTGGMERFHSVYLGLEAVNWHCDYAFIHDCARPFLDHGTLQRLYDAVCRDGACVAAMPSKDTVKIADADGFVSVTPNRSDVWIVQTPQVFTFELIRDAHRKLMAQLDEIRARGITITDDAMVAEYMTGTKVRLVEATYQNIKITTPEDIPLAEVLFLDH